MPGSTHAIASLTLAVAVLPQPLLAQTRPSEDREIAPLTGDLYRVRDGTRHTVFLVTPEGIVLGDPLSTATATWLRDEFAARFPGRPVRFVLHTHHHFDRAEGGGVFQSSERIAHRRFTEELSAARRTLPAFVEAVDYNMNGAFDAGEVADPFWGPLIAGKDRDGDGRVTPDELYRQVPDVRHTYDRRLDLSLGGRTVELIHPGSGHAADMTVLFFPAERVVFAADPPPIAAVPFTFGRWRPSETFDWMRTVATLDFDTMLFADGTMLSSAQVTSLAAYLEALREEVAAGYEQGFTLAQLRARGAPSSSPHAAARDQQIAAIFRTLRLTRVVLTGSGAGDYGVRAPAFCASFAACSTGGAVAIGTAAATITTGRLGLGAEVQVGAQSWHSRTSATYDEEFALRETRLGMLLVYGRPKRGFSFSVAGGPAFVIGDSKGIYRQKAALAPLGGRHSIADHAMRMGVTGGIDLVNSLGSRFGVIVPIRITRLLSRSGDFWPGATTITVGGGLSMRVLRQVH